MLKKDVEIGGIYEVRWHDGSITHVKIIGPDPYRSTRYSAINVATGRRVTIKSAAKLRRKVN